MNLSSLERPKTVRELLRDRGDRFHFFVDSAEGVRMPFDRKLASRRAAQAMRRLAARPG